MSPPPSPAPAAVTPAVRFDPAAARTLAVSLSQLADELERAAHRQVARRAAVGHDWTGCSRRWFDERQAHVVRALRDVATSARHEAATVLAAAASAEAAP